MSDTSTRPKLTIIIPARNEEDVVISTLKSIHQKVKIPHSIIVVNDNSTDNTKKQLKKYAQKYSEIRVIDNNPSTPGFANALVLGVQKSTTDYICLVMADLCDDPTTINKMYHLIQKEADVVAGSRYIKGGGKVGGPILQSVFSIFVCHSLHFLTGIPTRDVSNAFKMYKRAVLENIQINPSSGVEASMEITLQLYFQNFRIIDIPTIWTGRSVGRSKFKIIQRAPRYLKIYLWAIENTFRKNFGFAIKPLYYQ